MATYIKASLKRSYAESFLTELERNENQYFFFVAKSTPWGSENSPPAFTDTVASEYDVMNNIIAYKKITPANVYYALPRYEWVSGVTYDQYDDVVELFDSNDPKNFYVITDEFNVYKCLGNSGGSVSLEKPTQILPGAFSLSDGYVWQYLATIRETDLPYELSNYFPIDYSYVSDDSEVQNQYNAQLSSVPGSIDRIVLSGVGASGVSAGVYDKSLFGDSSIRLASITTIDSSTKEIVITDSLSRTLIGQNGRTPAQYVNHIIRISDSTVDPSDINNYGVIQSGQVVGNQVIFRIKNDQIDFRFTPPSSGNAQDIVRAEILPWIRLTGDGSGAYAFPVMSQNNNIQSVTIANGGINYSKVAAEVVSEKTTTSVHPTLRVVLSPKEGHGSNILKELNIQDIIVVVQINESDDESFKIGGSYRQFGIIKNPLLADGTERIAGSENEYLRDIILIPDDFYAEEDFTLSASASGFIVGDETFSSAKIVSISTEFDDVSVFDGQRVRLRTINSTDKFITRLERPNDYELLFSVSGSPSENFFVGEKIRQYIPSGTVFGNGTFLSYDLNVEGSVLESSSDGLIVRVLSGGNFVAGTESAIVGLQSGLSAEVQFIQPRYGEYVRIGQFNGEEAVFSQRNGTTKLYKIDSVGSAYYDTQSVPSYSGLHTLELSSSVSSAVGGVDLTSIPLTPSAFSNGQVVTQGSTSSVSNYASGVVYNWEFVNSSYGKLYLTGVTGTFIGVQTNGLTGTTLSSYIVATYTPPQIQRNSGEILYIDNVRPVTRGIGQKEEFRLRLGF